MLVFISGGVRSGKSTLGEKMSGEIALGKKYYLATSEIYDDEIAERVRLHKLQRKDKGFTTVEKSTQIGDIAHLFKKQDTVLLDCLGTLLANEMFGSDKIENPNETVVRIYEDIKKINESSENLIIVSNDVFSDGCRYQDSVIQYIDALALLHWEIVELADEAIECVSGNIIKQKTAML